MTFRLRLTTIDYRWSSVRLSESVIATEKVVDFYVLNLSQRCSSFSKDFQFQWSFSSTIIQLELVVSLERSDADGANVSIFVLGILVVKFGRDHYEESWRAVQFLVSFPSSKG